MAFTLPGPRRRDGVALVVLAAGLAAALLVPYLVSCAIVTGDPFFAVNYHTIYYRAAEGRDISAPMGAAEYLRTKVAARPVASADTGFLGLVVQPFLIKWHGLQPWLGGLVPVVRWIAAAGVAVLPFTRGGRLLLVILLASLAPYALTWNVGGGGEWRFTMHAYPLYLVAGALAVAAAVGAVPGLRSAAGRPRLLRALARRAAAVLGLLAAVITLYVGLLWHVVREAIAAGDSTSIETGDRDRLFYRDGWTAPHRDGVVVRVTTDARGSLFLPLPSRRAYDMVGRLDPVAPGRQQRFDVLVNGTLVARQPLEFNPERMGSYRFTVPAEIVREGENEVEVIPDRLVAARDAGPRVAWLDPDLRIGLRVWYVRVVP